MIFTMVCENTGILHAEAKFGIVINIISPIETGLKSGYRFRKSDEYL